jgi:hypothetical protein
VNVPLTEWVPVCAGAWGLPAELIHIRAQQLAKIAGITWAFKMDAYDVETLITALEADMAPQIERSKARKAVKK